MIGPLRYPGGKSDFAPIAVSIVQKSGLAGLPSLALLESEVSPHVTLVERDPLIFAFWHSVFNRVDELIVRFQELPITLKTWHDFQPLLRVTDPRKADIVSLGLAGLFFNRANFSGILAAGPIGGKGQNSNYLIDCRTRKDELIPRLLAASMFSEKVDVQFGDALKVILSHKNRKRLFFYVDPPYFTKGELLYRHSYRLSDHVALSRALTQCQFPWLLSYDVHHVIEHLYEGNHVQTHRLQYSARSPKHHEELLISNRKLLGLPEC
jgi:DNA adenine methylase